MFICSCFNSATLFSGEVISLRFQTFFLCMHLIVLKCPCLFAWIFVAFRIFSSLVRCFVCSGWSFSLWMLSFPYYVILKAVRDLLVTGPQVVVMVDLWLVEDKGIFPIAGSGRVYGRRWTAVPCWGPKKSPSVPKCLCALLASQMQKIKFTCWVSSWPLRAMDPRHTQIGLTLSLTSGVLVTPQITLFLQICH